MREGIISLPLFFIYMEKPNYVSEVVDIFNDFFGEENVDLQKSDLEELSIIVHFPKITVTNEQDKSIDITHLWVKIPISNNGTLKQRFTMLRSEYTLEQFLSGYSHSHIPPISRHDYRNWRTPCLGIGPIRSTICTLIRDFSEDTWKLFCLELLKYVTTESLAGGPYIRLERVALPSNHQIIFPISIERGYNSFKILNYNNLPLLNNFIKYIILKKPFKFSYADCYNIATSNYNTTIILSNLFIEWFNSLDSSERPNRSDLLNTSFINKVVLVKNNLYSEECADAFNTPNDTAPLLTFKGKEIKLNIQEIKTTINNNEFIILDTKVVKIIIHRILQIINYKYGREGKFTYRKTLGFI